MLQSDINSITINSLCKSDNFNGEFGILPLADLQKRLGDNSFKTRFYSLIVIEKGNGQFLIDQQVHDIAKKRIFFINYHQVFRISEISGSSGYAIVFTQSFYNIVYTANRKIKSNTAFAQLPPYIDFGTEDFRTFVSCLKELIEESHQKVLLRKEIICLLLKVLMLKYIRETNNADFFDARKDRKMTYVENFKTLVDQHFKVLKRTSDYAKKMSITPNYLNALIKENYELSAERYIQNRVILEAERLLLNTDLSVTEISFELGFSDKSHFGKYFKKINGKSPNNFRMDF